MNFRLLVLALLILPACNTPSPAFRGIPATRITVDGSTFDVRVQKGRAEALRVNAQYAPRFGVIRERATLAMARVSGCEVTKVTGDQALAFGKLKCGGKRTPVRPVPIEIECERIRGSGIKEVGQVRFDLDCTPA